MQDRKFYITSRFVFLLSILLFFNSVCPSDATPQPSLQELINQVLAYVESRRDKTPGLPYGAYLGDGDSSTRDRLLRATTDACLIRYIMNDLKNLTETQRKEWINYINSFQLPSTGAFNLGPPDSKAASNALKALNALGGRTRYPLVYLRKWDDVSWTQSWLTDRIKWSNGREAGRWAMHAVTPRVWLSQTDPAQKAYCDTFFAYLTRMQDPTTGLWDTRVEGRRDAIWNTFHLLPIYRAANRRMPNLRLMIDNIIADMGASDNWGGISESMDAAALASWWSRIENYRLNDVGNCCQRAVDWLFYSNKYLSNGSILNNLSDTIGGMELISVSAPVLPTTHPYYNAGWNQAWDPILWKNARF